MTVQSVSAVLVPTSFKRGSGQVSGGGVSAPQGALETCFSMGRVRNLETNISYQKLKANAIESEETAIFGGYAVSQFGHFIIESLGRLPSIASNNLTSPIIYLSGGEKSSKLLTWQRELIRSVGIRNKILILQRATFFSDLLVPTLHFHQNMRPFGDDIGRKWVEHRFPPTRDRLTRKLFVSRGKLPDRLGRFEQEMWLEGFLAKSGYDVVYPETLTVDQQIELYRSANRIIVSESSAIHLMNLVCSTNQEIAIIQRRPKIHPTLRRAVKYFSPSKMVCINAIRRFYVNGNATPNHYRGRSVLDFEYLIGKLAEFGFLTSADTEKVIDYPTVPEPETMLGMIDVLDPCEPFHPTTELI